MPATFEPTSSLRIGSASCGSFPNSLMSLGENQSLSQDFIDILSAFSEENVEYILVGGYALGFHGYARGTGDIDLWVRPEPANAERVMRALKRFGAPLFEVTNSDFELQGTVFQIGLPPNRIDVITDIAGVDFDTAWPGRKIISHQGLVLPLLEKALLLANKKAMARLKDLNDIAWLEKEEKASDPT